MLRRVTTLSVCNAGPAPTAPAAICNPRGPARTTHPRAATSTTPSRRLVGRDVLAQWPPQSQSDFADVTGCELLTVWAMMAPAPPATHRQYVTHRGGMLTHTKLLRDTADPTSSTKHLLQEEIRRDDLCAFMGQKDRFTGAKTFYHYDTPERKRVRGEMDRLLENAGNSTDPTIQVVLTGMGGTGKSHNLAYWVSLQRQAGHMVVYVHDMQNWLHGGDVYLFKEIAFAICRWKHWGATPASATMSLDTISEATKNTPWASTKNPTNPKLTLHETLLACVDAITSCEYDAYTTNPKRVLHDLRALLDALPPVEGACTFRPKLIFVVDQDNKLNKVLRARVTTVGIEQASTIDDVIATNTAHMTVASASANNEGWDRRDWPKRDSVVQGAHGLSADQADDMMKLLLPASMNIPMEKVLERIRDETGCCPIDMKIICRELSALTNSAIEMAAVEAAIGEWKGELSASFEKYVSGLRQDAITFASCVFERKRSSFYDRRYMEWRVRAHPYTYRNPYVTGLIVRWATVGASKESVSPSAWYERCVIYALPSLLKSNNTPLSTLWSMSTVFPHFSALREGVLDGLNVYQCVAMGHHIDAVSVDYKQHGDGTWRCHVGLYQITQNTNSHVDSYAKVSTCKELAQFERALLMLHKQLQCEMELDIRFFWIVDNVQGKKLALHNSVVLNLTETKRNSSDLKGTSWNFIYDAARVSTAERVQNANNTTTGESAMKEYVVEFKNTDFPTPNMVSV